MSPEQPEQSSYDYHPSPTIFFAAALDAMVIADDRGCYVDANPAACELFGLPREDLLGRCIRDFAPVEFDVEAAWQAFQARGQERGEFCLVRLDGTVREVEYAATANIYPHRHLSILRDVTERNQLARQLQHLNQALETQVAQRTTALEQANADLQIANQCLQASQQKYQTLFEILPVGVSITDAEGHLIEVNSASERILGVSIAEHTQRTCDEPTWQILRPDGSPMPADEYPAVRALQEQQPILGVEQGIMRPDGTVHWIETSAASIPLDTYGVAIAYVDITDRKTAEIALRQSEATNRAVLSVLPDLLIQMHRDGTYLHVYKHTGIRLLHDDDAEVGNSIFDCVPAPMAQERMTYVQRALDTNCLQIYEYPVAFVDETRYEEARIMPMTEDTVLVLVRDITDRKTAELALRQREQEFRTLAENSPDNILRVNRAFQFVYVNPTVSSLTGLPSNEFLGKTSQELGFPEHLVTLWHGAMEQAFITGQEQGLAYDMALIVGNQSFYSRVVPELAEDGSIDSVLVVGRDITDLKQAQDRLLFQAEQERLISMVTQQIRQSLDLHQVLATAVEQVRQLLQADRVVIYRFNADGSGKMIAESVAAPWTSVLGSTLYDPCFTGDLVTEYRQGRLNRIDDLHHSNLAPCYRDLLANFQIQASLAMPITSDDNLWGLLAIHHCAAPHSWQSWEVELLQPLVAQLAIAVQQANLYSQMQQLNITLEEQVQDRTDELRQALQSEMLLKRITDQVRDSLDENKILETVVQELGRGLGLACCDTGIYNAEQTTSTIAHEFTPSFTSAKGMILTIANATHAEIYPFLFEGQILQFCDLIPCSLRPNQGQLTILACAIRDDQQVLGDLWLSKLPEEIFSPLEVRLVQQVANQCAIALRQSRLYHAAQDQVLELERLNRLKDDFLSTVSHELRTPMASIKMATELLEIHLKKLDLLPSDDAEPSATIANPIARYFQILQDEGQREITLINDLLDLARMDAHTEPLFFSTINIHYWLPHVLEPFVCLTQKQQQTLTTHLPMDLPTITTDLSHLQRVLTELLNNACKYTPPGETISLSVQIVGDMLELRVANSGVDIPAVECDRMFDRFYRIPNNDPWKHGGTGLGLALVKKLVEYMHGTIWIECGANEIQFVLHLPLENG